MTNVNDPPCARRDRVATFTTKDTKLHVVHPTCIDIDGDTLTYAIGAIHTAHGACVLNGTRVSTPIRPLGYVPGTDSFTFTASDARGPT